MEKLKSNVVFMTKKQFECIADAIRIWVNRYFPAKPIDRKCFEQIMSNAKNVYYEEEEIKK